MCVYERVCCICLFVCVCMQKLMEVQGSKTKFELLLFFYKILYIDYGGNFVIRSWICCYMRVWKRSRSFRTRWLVFFSHLFTLVCFVASVCLRHECCLSFYFVGSNDAAEHSCYRAQHLLSTKRIFLFVFCNRKEQTNNFYFLLIFFLIRFSPICHNFTSVGKEWTEKKKRKM